MEILFTTKNTDRGTTVSTKTPAREVIKHFRGDRSAASANNWIMKQIRGWNEAVMCGDVKQLPDFVINGVPFKPEPPTNDCCPHCKRPY